MLRIASIAALIALSVARSQTLPAPVDGSVQGKDFVLHGSLAFNGGSGAADSTITICKGSVIEHTIADDGAQDRISQRMRGGSNISSSSATARVSSISVARFIQR